MLLGLAALWAASRAWRYDHRIDWLEDRITESRQALALSREEIARRDAEVEASGARIRFLGAELEAALRQSAGVQESLAERVEDIERLHAELEERRRAVGRPMPEGVRLVLAGIAERIAADGHDGLRFVHAAACAERELREVELMERDPEGWSTTFHRAGRLRLILHRESSSLSLLLFEGVALRAGAVEEYPETGYRIELLGIDGPAWEDQLGFLVRAEGEYPPAPDDPEQRLPVLDPLTRATWIERIDGLLSRAGSDVRWRLQRFQTLDEGRFGKALLLGSDPGGVLLRTAEADELAVEVDREAGTVSLRLEGGVLHQQGGDTRIPDSGYRILLPGVRPAQAIDSMLGLVVTPR